MRVAERRVAWLSLGLAVLAVNLFGLAAWRVTAAYSGQAERLWWYEPSPLEAESERLTARHEDLIARLQAGDPAVKFDDVVQSLRELGDVNTRLTADQNARWDAAQAAEARVYVWSGLAALVLGLAAGALFGAYLYSRAQPAGGRARAGRWRDKARGNP
jgi:hypothetical protein